MFSHGLHTNRHYFLCLFPLPGAQCAEQLFLGKHLPLFIHGLGHTVSIEQHCISRSQLQGVFLVYKPLHNAQHRIIRPGQEPGSPTPLLLVQDNRRIMAGIYIAYLSRNHIYNRSKRRNKLFRLVVLAKLIIGYHNGIGQTAALLFRSENAAAQNSF